MVYFVDALIMKGPHSYPTLLPVRKPSYGPLSRRPSRRHLMQQRTKSSGDDGRGHGRTMDYVGAGESDLGLRSKSMVRGLEMKFKL